MPTIKLEQIKDFDLGNIRQILVVDIANKFHGPLEIWALKPMGELIGSGRPAEPNRGEQLLIEVGGEVTQEKLAEVMTALQSHKTPPEDRAFMTVSEWERWGFDARLYPRAS